MIPFVLRFKNKGNKRYSHGNALSQQGGISQLQGGDQPQEVGHGIGTNLPGDGAGDGGFPKGGGF